MPLLNTADAVYVGDTLADRVYVGDALVWSATPVNDIPAGITVLHRWKATSIAQADGTAVAAWPPLTGAATLGQGTPASRPTLQTNELNGKPVVRFDGVDDFLFTSSGLAADPQPLTIYVVIKCTTTATFRHFLTFGGVEAMVLNGVTRRAAAGTVRDFGTYTLGTWEVWAMVFDGASSVMAANGTAFGTGSPGAGAGGTSIYVGRHHSATDRYFIGDIAEIIHCDGAHDATQRAGVHTYIQNEYGITVADYIP